MTSSIIPVAPSHEIWSKASHMETKRYLGDGIYTWHDGFQFWLSTNQNGQEIQMALEPNTLDAFMKFIEKTWNVKMILRELD